MSDNISRAVALHSTATCPQSLSRKMPTRTEAYGGSNRYSWPSGGPGRLNASGVAMTTMSPPSQVHHRLHPHHAAASGLSPWTATNHVGNSSMALYQPGRHSAVLSGAAAVSWTAATVPTADDEKRERRRRRQQRVVNCCKRIVAFLFSHVGLAGMIVAYSIIGGLLFQALEAGHEREVKVAVGRFKRQKIDDIAHLHATLPPDETFRNAVTTILTEFQRKVVEEVKMNGWDGKDGGENAKLQWSFAGALLYAVTVITTIGYGHIAPKTNWGRMITILYALVGIPLTFLYLSNIGNFMADCFRLFYKRICCDVCCCQKCERKRKRQKLKLRRRREIAEQRNVFLTPPSSQPASSLPLLPPPSADSSTGGDAKRSSRPSKSKTKSTSSAAGGSVPPLKPEAIAITIGVDDCQPEVTRSASALTAPVNRTSKSSCGSASTNCLRLNIEDDAAAPTKAVKSQTISGSDSRRGAATAAYDNIRETDILGDEASTSGNEVRDVTPRSMRSGEPETELRRSRLLSDFLKSKETDIVHETGYCVGIAQLPTPTTSLNRSRDVEPEAAKKTQMDNREEKKDESDSATSSKAVATQNEIKPVETNSKTEKSKSKADESKAKSEASKKKVGPDGKPRRRFFRRKPTDSLPPEPVPGEQKTQVAKYSAAGSQPQHRSTSLLSPPAAAATGSSSASRNRSSEGDIAAKRKRYVIEELNRTRRTSGPETALRRPTTAAAADNAGLNRKRKHALRSHSTARRPDATTLAANRKLKRNATFGAPDTTGNGGIVGSGSGSSALLRKVRQQLTPNLANMRRRPIVTRRRVGSVDSSQSLTGNCGDIVDSSESFVTAHGDSILNLDDIADDVDAAATTSVKTSLTTGIAGSHVTHSDNNDDAAVDDVSDDDEDGYLWPPLDRKDMIGVVDDRTSTADLIIFPDDDDAFDVEEEAARHAGEEKVSVPISICLIIIAVYIIAGSALFAVWEGWDYLTGSYFCFITLSTIGFGDFVPGTDNEQWASHEKLVLCALWLAFGLSLLAMCFNLMQEEVKEKCKWLGRKLGLLKDENVR